MDDFAAERANVLERCRQIGHREVGEREAVARPLPALMHSDRDLSMVGLPALTFVGLPGCEGDPQERFPEPSRPFGVVGWELDQERGRHASTLLGTPVLWPRLASGEVALARELMDDVRGQTLSHDYRTPADARDHLLTLATAVVR
jgi:hypothetical protein